MVVQKAAPINGPNFYYNWIYLEKVRKMVRRVCNQTCIRLFIINSLLRCLFGKVVQKAVHSYKNKSYLFSHCACN